MQSIDLQQCYSLVKEFHSKFQFKKQTEAQRFAILNEELNEFYNATNDIDRLDGLVDSLYVELGTLINFEGNINDFDDNFYVVNNRFSDFNGAFREVHRSNMSKSCKTLDEVHKTIAGRQNLTYELVDGMYFVKDENQKLIKSVDYSKANLEPYI